MRVVFLGYQDIFGNVNNGGIQGSRRNYDLVSSFSEVFVALLSNNNNQTSSPDNVKNFPMLTKKIDVLFAALGLRKWYSKWVEKEIVQYIIDKKPDVLFLDGSIFGSILTKIPNSIKSVVYFHNVEADYALNKVKNEGVQYLPSYFASMYNEKQSAKLADCLVSLNLRDGRRIEKLYKRNPDYYLPVSFYDRLDSSKIKRDSASRNLLFIGSLFAPNYHGIKWFVDKVMPRLEGFHLTIVGKDFEQKKEELESDCVSVIGTVDDLSEYYYTFSALVMPIHYGAGMKVKTAEAMMYGATIFATDEALEGYNVDAVRGIYRCNTEDEFVDSINKAYLSGEIEIFAEEVRNVYLDNNNTERHMSAFKEKMEELVYDK